MEIIENEFMKFWIEDEIMFSEFKIQTEMTLENLKQLIDMRHKISNNEKQLWCYNFKLLGNYTKEARDYAESHGQDFLYGTAVIVTSPLTLFILNTFMMVKKARIPLKAFKKKEDAVKWLYSIKAIALETK